MENKFLIFVCNISNTHWLSVVVVNPGLVLDKFLHDVVDLNHEDDVCGWCVLNFNAIYDTDMEENGFQGTVGTKNKASYGVHLFLNICASYLLSKKGNEGEGKQTFRYHHPEPFGIFTESFGTEEFPQFDFQCPSIIRQNNAYVAVVANSMGFVEHLKSVKFRKTHMKRQEISTSKGSKEVRFYLQEKKYSL